MSMHGRVFYGWVVVGALSVVLAVAAGLGFYNVSVYLRVLTAEGGFSLAGASGATALFFVVFGLAGIPIGRLLGRVDGRWVIVAGALLGGLALLLLGLVTALWQLYAVYALFGLGFAASSMVPATTLVTRWFVRRQALALSVATTGLSVGGVLITPLSAAWIERVGLAVTTPWLALGYVVGIAPIAVLLVRADPGQLGLAPDGGAATPSTPAPAALLPYAEAVRSRTFRTLSVAFLLLFLAQVGGFTHLYTLVSERLDVGAAALTLSVIAVASIVGRFAGAAVLARVPVARFTLWLAVVQTVSLAALALAGDSTVVLAAAALFGTTIGNVLVVGPLLLVEAFGGRDYARLYALLQLVATLGIAAGPVLLGVLRGGSGGYALPYLLAAVASTLAAAVLATLPAGGPDLVQSPTTAPSVRGSEPPV